MTPWPDPATDQTADPGRRGPVGAFTEAGLELRALADEFRRSDEIALRRSRIAGWTVSAVVTLFVVLLLAAGADGTILGLFWAILLLVLWSAYALSARRQRAQIRRLLEQADVWQARGSGGPAPITRPSAL